MTCIVAVTDGQNIVLGADSLGQGIKPHQQIRKDPKIFTTGHFLVGFTTSFRMGQVLMHSEFPAPPMTEDAEKALRFMVREFVPTAKGCLEAGGFTRSISATHSDGYQETRHALGGTFIVGFRRIPLRGAGGLFGGHAGNSVHGDWGSTPHRIGSLGGYCRFRAFSARAGSAGSGGSGVAHRGMPEAVSVSAPGEAGAKLIDRVRVKFREDMHTNQKRDAEASRSRCWLRTKPS